MILDDPGVSHRKLLYIEIHDLYLLVEVCAEFQSEPSAANIVWWIILQVATKVSQHTSKFAINDSRFFVELKRSSEAHTRACTRVLMRTYFHILNNVTLYTRVNIKFFLVQKIQLVSPWVSSKIALTLRKISKMHQKLHPRIAFDPHFTMSLDSFESLYVSRLSSAQHNLALRLYNANVSYYIASETQYNPSCSVITSVGV